MEMTTFLYIILKSALMMVMLFGAYLTFMQIPRGKVKKLVIILLLFWAMLLSADLYSVASNMMSSSSYSAPPALLVLGTMISSQLVILWVFYNLLFTLRQSCKIIMVHVFIVAALLGLVWAVDGEGVADYFIATKTLAEVYAGITTKLLILKALIVFLQLSFSLAIIFTSYRLVPIYQRYIEQNEANATYNLLWIKEVSSIIFVITVVYNLAVIFTTYTNSIIYYVVVIFAYMRMINIFLQHKMLDNFDDMYNQLGIKWSWKRMWYIDEVVSIKSNNLRTEQSLFNNIINWISSERPYTNPNFSFKDIAQQFSGMTYNEFDALIKESKGLNFQSYIRECRIDDAIELMNNSREPMLFKEVAYLVGFDSSSSFSRAFKAAKGIPASEWRANS